MDYINLIQWPAMVATVVAAWLVASQHKRKREFGFWCFLFSNVLWVSWGLHDGAYALIALQGVDDPLERRRQGVKRGRLALDALDELKIGLLGGTLTPATLNKLRSAAAFLKDDSGEAGLDGVLDEIELRVEVEIAKLSTR